MTLHCLICATMFSSMKLWVALLSIRATIWCPFNITLTLNELFLFILESLASVPPLFFSSLDSSTYSSSSSLSSLSSLSAYWSEFPDSKLLAEYASNWHFFPFLKHLCPCAHGSLHVKERFFFLSSLLGSSINFFEEGYLGWMFSLLSSFLSLSY